MYIELTEDLMAQALNVAAMYKPLLPPLLVGSCVWLGRGKDIDVVVFVDDVQNARGGDGGGRAAYGGMATYRHGPVNIIAVDDERIWAGWRWAADIMPGMPKAQLAAKSDRVAACEALRALGEKQCQSA